MTLPARRLATLAAALAAGGACAAGAAAPGVAATAKPSVALTIRFDNGAGKVVTGTLTCRPGVQKATGAARPAPRSCARVRALARFLTTPPSKGIACTLIYGGPQTARATGTIGARKVSRRFSKRNGCEIADYERFAKAFGR